MNKVPEDLHFELHARPVVPGEKDWTMSFLLNFLHAVLLEQTPGSTTRNVIMPQKSIEGARVEIKRVTPPTELSHLAAFSISLPESVIWRAEEVFSPFHAKGGRTNTINYKPSTYLSLPDGLCFRAISEGRPDSTEDFDWKIWSGDIKTTADFLCKHVGSELPEDQPAVGTLIKTPIGTVRLSRIGDGREIRNLPAFGFDVPETDPFIESIAEFGPEIISDVVKNGLRIVVYRLRCGLVFHTAEELGG